MEFLTRRSVRAALVKGQLIFCGLATLVQVSVPTAEVRAAAATEQDRRPACLFKLAEFVDWPAQAFPAPQAPLVIGILGADPFGKTLDEIVKDEVVKNRKLVVQRYQRLDEIKTCHILFISQSEAGHVDEILAT